jgi:alanine racemase
MLGLPYTLAEIAQLVEARDLFQGLFENLPLHYVAYDTRLISHPRETLFVALRTPHRDGHEFIAAALSQGVCNFLVSRPLPFRGINYALVSDPLDALQRWALLHRQRFRYPVLGITGSNGKTIVKEWLATLLDPQLQVVKSPMSYNSQLGVPLSLLQLRPLADLALIEAGISQAGEMALLQAMIQPTQGILTHMGSAHTAGFASEQQKLREKLLLFQSAECVYAGSFQPEPIEALRAQGLPLKTAGYGPEDTLQVLEERSSERRLHWRLRYEGQEWACTLPLDGQADRENALLALLAALELGLPPQEAPERLAWLAPVEMRSEMITDNPEITLINDSYNSDADSIRNAFRLLLQTQSQPRRHIILSDIMHQGQQQEALQREILAEAEQVAGPSNVWTVGPVFGRIGHGQNYLDTEALLRDIRYERFRGSTVLLKGARRFELERVIPLLSRKLNAARFQIDLDALGHNFRLLKSQLPDTVKTMCMVKAFSYGSGDWEVAQELERAGADYLAVAFASEAIGLREAGIRLPLMVLNPDHSSIESLLRHDIEPEVSNLDFLQAYLRAARLAEQAPRRIHLKLETGMGRLGFVREELPQVCALLQRHPDIALASLLTHMAAADDPAEDAYTHAQARAFAEMAAYLSQELGVAPLRHVLNTAGVLRFPEYAFDMVRLGIGLYGISPAGGLPLREIGSLRASITQIRDWPAGQSIGYGRSQFTARPSRIATLPVGYADGIPRSLGNGKISFLAGGAWAPTFGRICMDMLMLDVTGIPGLRPGDEVVLIGRQGEHMLSVSEVAQAAGTIPYEILVRISPRVRRVYLRGG